MSKLIASRCLVTSLPIVLCAMLSLACGRAIAAPRAEKTDETQSTEEVAERDGDKSPVPSESDQAAATATINDVFGKEIAAAQKSGERSRLAKKLLEEGVASKDEIAAQFALFKMAIQLSIAAGDCDMAFAATTELGRQFAVDVLSENVTVVTAIAKSAKNPNQAMAVARHAMSLMDEAVREDQYDVAKQIANVAVSAARNTKDKPFNAKVVAQVKEMHAVGQAYGEARTALSVLANSPTDEQANATVGFFRCLIKADWDGGLPLIALGNDAKLQRIADLELADKKTAKQRLSLGDAWWAFAADAESVAKRNAQLRAAYWYRLALPDLSGLSKSKIEKLLAELPTADSGSTDTFLLALTPKETTIQKGTTLQSVPATFKGVSSPQGLFTHPPESKSSAHLKYALGQRYQVFEGKVAINDTAGEGAASPLTFRIVADGKPLWKATIQKIGESQDFRVAVSDVKVLELFVDCPGSYVGAHAIWFEPRLTGGSKASAPKPESADEAAWKLLVGHYDAVDGGPALEVEVGDNGSPQIRRHGGVINKSVRIRGAWLFSFGDVDLFAISPQKNGTLLTSLYWKASDEGFSKKALPSRTPDEKHFLKRR